ncbi:glycosylated lysosomal membrane protein B-like [Phlebotomus argentipes]|uniref:glycosylated lysosomal membrane protein B-like n=1 Tax=Phlebotomus argentipes TaxID=94469 RepID=UPI0028934643|nr:glycosylated lysosomal membrane protein B-like [Phlebotomus argentipes]
MKWYLWLLNLGLFCAAADGRRDVRRKLTAELNPGCPESICDELGNITSVVHVRSLGARDTIHYVWDLTGKPSALVALCSPDAKLSINWEDFLDGKIGSVSFSETPRYIFGVVLSRLWEYNDEDDVGTFTVTNASQVNAFSLHGFAWERQLFRTNDDSVELSVKSHGAKGLPGNFELSLATFATPDHGPMTPHLMHTENSTQIDLILDSILTNETFPQPRFAIEVVLVAMESRKDNYTVVVRKSLDDEFTPGIFKIVNVASPASVNASSGGYLQYRPVSYTHEERDVSTSTQTYQSSPATPSNAIKKLNNTLFRSIFGDSVETMLVQALNVSFGASGDGFYTKYNYTTWTFVVGYGAPLPDKLSLFVVVVATIGLGVPLLLLCCGGCYVCVKRVRNNS